ncbi:Inner membrane protein yfeZ [Serratia liquefaciens]|nr:Inner membrane protein yfeZ [Serratia liquefaciens]
MLKPLPPRFSPDDYDQHGALRLPLWFWGLLILQARTWILFVMAGVSRQQGEGLLSLFYPDTQWFWYGIVLGLPAALAFLIAPRRHQWPRLWRAWRWVLIASLLAALGGSLFSLWQQDDNPSALDIVLALLDALALAYLLLSARLKACFVVQDEVG